MISAQNIKELATEVGFDLCGIADTKQFAADEAEMLNWLEEGCAEGLDYLARNIEKRFDISLLVEGAKSVIVCAVNYRNDYSAAQPADTPHIASYALFEDYHNIIKRMLNDLATRLELSTRGIAFRAFCDTAPVLEKAWAERVGLGWRGRNSLLITPEYGSTVLLGELVICEEVDTYDTPSQPNRCGTCRRCIESCPTGAIREDRHIDTRRCISRLTIERGGEELRASGGGNTEGRGCTESETNAEAKAKGETNAERGGSAPTSLNGWIFGCEVCQQVCPHNMGKPLHTNASFTPIFSPAELSEQTWLEMEGSDFSKRFKGTSLKRAGLERIRTAVITNLKTEK